MSSEWMMPPPSQIRFTTIRWCPIVVFFLCSIIFDATIVYVGWTVWNIVF